MIDVYDRDLGQLQARKKKVLDIAADKISINELKELKKKLQ